MKDRTRTPFIVIEVEISRGMHPRKALINSDNTMAVVISYFSILFSFFSYVGFRSNEKSIAEN